MLFLQYPNKLKFIFAICLAMFGIAQCFAYDLKIGTYTSPPFSMQEDGEDIGLATEAVRNLLKKSGIESYTISYYPIARGLFELKNNRVDIYYPYISKFSTATDEFILIGPISRYRVALFVRKDYNAAVSLEALKDFPVGAERGSIGDVVLMNHAMHIEQATQEVSCLKMVLAERVVACAMGALTGMYSAAINDLASQLRHVQTSEYADMYIAIRANLPPELIEKIRNTYTTLKEESFFEKQQLDYEKKFAMFIKTLS